MKKVLIISDVHTDKNIIKRIMDKEDFDISIFAGDLQLKDFSPLDKFDYKILGNSDYRNKNIEDIEIAKIEGVNILVTHGHLFGSWTKKIDFGKLATFAKSKKCTVVIYGHDHIKSEKIVDDIFFFNPGSTTFPRDGENGSYGVMEIQKGKEPLFYHKKITGL